MRIVNSAGVVRAEYTYNAWGELLEAEGALATINPLWYRGYVYDQETGLYYLNSRYYDPANRRMLSPDDLSVLNASPTSLNDKNLYAYCDNNPVSRKDDDGQFWHIIGGAVVGALAGMATKALTNALAGERVTKGLFTAGVAGLISGGLAASGVGLAGQMLGNAALGMATNATDQFIGMVTGEKTDNFDVGSVLLDGAIGAAAGFAGGSGAGTKSLSSIGITGAKRTLNALTHKGVTAAGKVFTKGIVYFSKNAKHIVKPLLASITKASFTVVAGNRVAATLF